MKKIFTAENVENALRFLIDVIHCFRKYFCSNVARVSDDELPFERE